MSAAPAATPAVTRSCGSVGGEGVIPTRIRATGTSCARAKRVADRAAKVRSFGGCVVLRGTRLQFAPCTINGFRCRTIRRIGFDDSGVRVACRSGGAQVKFDLQ